jgi:periplasmic copper chaperone A
MKFLLALLLFVGFTSAPKLKVSNAWLRPAAKGMNSALYFTVENNSEQPDTLYKVTSSAAEIVQLHKSYTENGMMAMKRVKYVVIKPHSKVEFKPGGYHVMFIKATQALKDSDWVNVSLYFKSAGKAKIKVEVKK